MHICMNVPAHFYKILSEELDGLQITLDSRLLTFQESYKRICSTHFIIANFFEFKRDPGIKKSQSQLFINIDVVTHKCRIFMLVHFHSSICCRYNS